MKNPLENFADIEERDDGLYIRVSPEKKDTVDMDAVNKDLTAANVQNHDIEKIKEIFLKASGSFEKAGPNFKYGGNKIDRCLAVEIKPLEAFLTVSGDLVMEDVDLTADMLIECLHRKGVKYGIKREVIDRFVDAPVYDDKFCVAEGSPPEKGKDGEINLEISIKADARPHAKGRGSGQVDFKEIRSFNTVEEGQILAKRIPPEKGKDGTAVSGEKIEAQPGKDVSLPQGKNTQTKDNNTRLVASKTGIVYKDGGIIHVKQLLEVPKNVDYSVGNIKYSGDIYIRENVKPGFTVESEGDVYIAGEVDRANVISRNGSVTIKKGIFGKGEAKIFGKQGVEVSFAQEAEITSDEIIRFEKYLMNCVCRSKKLVSSSQSASIIGGDISVFRSLETGDLGNDKSTRTKVTIVNREAHVAEAKVKKLKELKEQLAVEMEPLKKEIKHKSSMMRKVDKNTLSPKIKEQLSRIVNSYSKMKSKMEYIDNMIAEQEDFIENPQGLDGYVLANGTVYPNVEINLYNIKHEKIKSPAKGRRITLDNAVNTEK